MPINPLQLPPYAAPRDIDFSSLAQLPQVYRQAQADALRREVLSGLGQGSSHGDISMRLAQAGDLQGAISLANLDRLSAAPDQTNEIKEYNMAVRQGFQGSFLDYKAALKRAGR